jgi:hypothetical protein
MFRKNTTFVIGAGASAEFGLPVGWQLADKIKRRSECIRRGPGLPVPRDEFLANLLRYHFGEKMMPEVFRCLAVISNGIKTAVSIDAFIDRFRDDILIATLGKLLITLEIADAERDSMMHSDQIATQQFIAAPKTADDTWIGSFAKILFDGVSNPNEIGGDLTIICFNYDRCIEHYLAETIATAYDVKLQQAETIVDNLNIIHPYGTLGALPTTAIPNGPDVLPFGPILDETVDWVEIASRNIRTYTEQRHEPATIKRIHDAVAQAESLIFLGFGFNNQNLDLLRVANVPEYGESDQKNVFSSGRGIPQQVDETIKRRIMHLLWDNPMRHRQNQNRVHVEYGQSCSELFGTHNMNFSSFTRSTFIGADNGSGLERMISPRRSDD